MFYINIKNKIMVSFVVLLILGFAISALTVSYKAKEIIIKHEIELAIDKSKSISNALSQTYFQAEQNEKMGSLLLTKAIKNIDFFGNEKNFNGYMVKEPIFNNNTELLNNTALAEEFYQLTGNHLTIFLKTGSDFIRILSSLKDLNGKSATGTLLDTNSNSYKAIMNKQSYKGKTKLFGVNYLSSYTPIIRKNDIIGIAFVGTDINKSQQSLISTIKKIKWGKTGYSYLTDLKGQMIYHPTVAPGKYSSLDFVKKGIEGAHVGVFKGIEKFYIVKKIPGWNYLLVGGTKTEEFLEVVDTINKTVLLTSSVICIIGLFILFFVIRNAFKPLNSLSKFLKDLSEEIGGDLTIRLDETGRNEVSSIAIYLNRFISNLGSMIKEVAKSNDLIVPEINSLHIQSSESNLMLSKHIEETEQAVAALNEMKTASLSVAENAEKASSYTSLASEDIRLSDQLMNDAAQSVTNLVSTINDTSQEMEHLSENAEQIGSVLDIIGSIAEQTNLLALNAAIEAARAGDQGRGFAVVADEVRTLAKRTQESTSEIASKLEQLNSGAQLVSSSVLKTKENCEETSTKTLQVKDNISSMSEKIVDLSDMNAQIATAAVEQNVVVEEINRNMIAMKELVIQLEKNSSNVAGTSSRLENANSELSKMVNKFKLS